MRTLDKFLRRLAKSVAEFMGSWWSVFSFLLIISIWIIFNTLSIINFFHIDPYPFSFLNLILGVLAALTGPLVLIGNKSQERHNQRLVESIYEMEKKQNKILENLKDKED